jgi:hypothetical protein
MMKLALTALLAAGAVPAIAQTPPTAAQNA